jgi:RNA-directed DNA polymerase
MKQGNSCGAKGHYFRQGFRRKEQARLNENLSLEPRPHRSDEEKLRDFQRKLYTKAKQEVNFRFYSLYDKLYLPYVLKEAYKRCRLNGGAPGVDGKTFAMIDKEGVEEFLARIGEKLRDQTYKPNMVKRAYIPKPNGKMRPLGIPTIEDRTIQMACKLVIEPIFEADFQDDSYGYRPRRSASDAIKKIKEYLQEGKTEIYDADLSSCFDTIPHKELLHLIGLRISDGRILHLIKMWLKATIWEDGKTIGGKGNEVGTPQGGVISPLLANIFLNLLDRAVKRMGGVFQKAGVKIVRYADDFLLMAKKLDSVVLGYLQRMIEKMKLKLNEEKTRILVATDKAFDFLGFTIRYDKDLYGRNKKYINIIPSKRPRMKIREKIDKLLEESGCWPPEAISGELNMMIRGWVNYFSIRKVSYPQEAKRELRYYLMDRLNRYYRRKSQRKSKLYNRRAYETLVSKYGLIELSKCSFNLTPANA